MPNPGNRTGAIEVVRGETKFLEIKVKTSEGRAVNLDPVSMYMTVRKRPDTDPLISKRSGDGIDVVDAAAGKALITLNINDTNIEAGEYRYDVWIEYTPVGETLQVRQPVIAFAPLHVKDGLTDFS